MQESKFAGVFGDRTAPETSSPGRSEAPAAPRNSMGRPRGKRSNPEYRGRTVLMREQLHFEATDILRRQKPAKDLSELMNLLLEQWVKKQKS